MMANDLERCASPTGAIEHFGASQKLNDELVGNLADRGQLAGVLLLATLTETPFTPEIDGTRFGIEVKNIYMTDPSVDEGFTLDKVEEAADALQEFVHASVPGTDKVKLEAYKTNYSYLLDGLLPGRKVPADQRAAFDEAFVEYARHSDINISSPDQGKKIISAAPKKVLGLRLTDHNNSLDFRKTQTHDLVTEAGRIIEVTSQGKLLSDKIDYYLSTAPANLRKRGGRAPGSTIVSAISDRVIDLRTRSSRRTAR